LLSAIGPDEDSQLRNPKGSIETVSWLRKILGNPRNLVEEGKGNGLMPREGGVSGPRARKVTAKNPISMTFLGSRWKFEPLARHPRISTPGPGNIF
jgi:hypothetical protein